MSVEAGDRCWDSRAKPDRRSASTKPVLVVGGTGKTGRRVATQLTQHGATVRVASRSGPTRFDWSDESTWASALDGVGAAYVVTAGASPALDRFSDLALAHGVERLVLLSARAWQHTGDAELLVTERQVRESGARWTILRPTWFSQNFTEEPFLAQMVREGEVRLSTTHGLVPFVDAEDIAAVAVAALTEDGHEGRIYELSGPRMLSFAAAVDEVARCSGRRITFAAVAPDQLAADLDSLGFGPEFAAFLNRMLGWVESCDEAYLSDGVERVLGREPRDFARYAHDAFR